MTGLGRWCSWVAARPKAWLECQYLAIAWLRTPLRSRRARSRGFRARAGVLCCRAVIRLPLHGEGRLLFSLPTENPRHDRQVRQVHQFKAGDPCVPDPWLVWLTITPMACLDSRTAPRPEPDRRPSQARIGSQGRSQMSTCAEMLQLGVAVELYCLRFQLLRHQFCL